MNNIITFTGAQGTGKSTMKNALLDWFNSKHIPVIDQYPGVKESPARDAKNAGFIINEETNFETQYFIAHSYIKGDMLLRKLLESNAGFKYSVLDRSPLDVIPYTNLSKNINKEDKDLIYDTLVEHFARFPSTLVYCEPLDIIIGDEHRSVDKVFQRNIDNEFVNLFLDLSESPIALPACSVEERLEFLLNALALDMR